MPLFRLQVVFVSLLKHLAADCAAMKAVLMKAVFVLLHLAALVAVKSQPDSTECLVKRNGNITPPAVQYLQLYITMLSDPFKLEFRFFEDANEHETTHDVLSLNNTYSVHSKVRDGRTTHHTQPLPILFPDGWTTVRLTLAARALSVEYVLNNASKEIISLPLDHNIHELSFSGTAALCSAPAGSPAWEAHAGLETVVLFQPAGKQWVAVTAGASATPYFKLPGETKEYSIPPNISAEVFIWERGNYFTTIVSMCGEELARNNASYSVPRTLAVGGASHIHLLLSPPAIPADQCTVSSPSSAPGHTNTIVVVVVVVVLVAAVGVCVAVKHGATLKKKFCPNISDNAEAHSDDSRAERVPMN